VIKIWASHGLSTEVVISGAFINFLLHNHIINIKKKIFFRRSKRQEASIKPKARGFIKPSVLRL